MNIFRRIAHWLHLVAATLVVLGVVVQVYLAAGQLFGADSLDAHTEVGWAVHTLEVLVFLAALAAWLPRADIVLSFLLALVGTLQITPFANQSEWVGAIHGGGALVVFALAALVAHRSARALTRARRGPAPAAPAGTGTPPPPA
ncbi:MAG TPA: hypothetical protein VNT23_10250 [Gaiellaceae bacterium]|nr:hypothetical protein [Gaiellaceae bacterium]